jgi:predicted SAM-dependent methyltransferase
MKRYVQYGCGFTAPDNWINYDASPTLRFERLPILGKLYVRNSQRFPANVKYGDIVDGLPEGENQCDGIYCSHVLEHLSYTDFLKALKNSYKILKPGGIFRAVLPDLKTVAEDYLKSYDTQESPAYNFMTSTMLGIEVRNKTLPSVMKSLFGNSKHLWMWDYKSLQHELQKAGFKNIRPCSYHDSTDTFFLTVEQEDRFYKAVSFECKK